MNKAGVIKCKSFIDAEAQTSFLIDQSALSLCLSKTLKWKCPVLVRIMHFCLDSARAGSSSALAHSVGTNVENTCKEGHEHGHPAQYVRPGEAPVSETPAQEVHCHSGVDGHSQQNKESGDEKHDSCSKGTVEPLEGGEMREGHDAGDDPSETCHS